MRRTTKATITFGLALAMSAGLANVVAGEPESGSATKDEAKKILRKAEAALKDVKSASYYGRYEGTGWVKQYVPTVEGNTKIGEPSKYDITRFQCEAKLTPQGADEALELTAGSDGELFYLIDMQAKIAYADIDPAVLGSHQRGLQRLLLRELAEKEPLAEDLKVENVQLTDEADVSGEACHTVVVDRGEDPKTTWYISKKDWLPRRVDRIYHNPEGTEGSTTLVLDNLVASPTMKTAMFELVVPKGFKKTDDFAP